jgi:uncharacterized protein with HEPN domain
MQPDSVALLHDVVSSAAAIAEFIDAIDEQQYIQDRLRRSAVERQLEIIGEALRKLRDVDPATAALFPDIARIIGLRNVLAHAYAVVDDRVVWAAASERVPELRAAVEALTRTTP